jgi:hypothetical protein
MSDTVISRQALARTFSHQIYDDGWQWVEDYQSVGKYHEEHPNASPYQISKALGLPRSRVGGWLEGSTPYPVSALSTAEAHGWFDATWNDQVGHALNRLVALVFCSGSISQRDFAPIFVADDDLAEKFIRKALDTVGCGARKQHTDDSMRATQLVPHDDGHALGRVLYVLGAPTGTKKAESDITLPVYLDTAPDTVRRDFVETYVSLRGQSRPNRSGWVIRESRPEEFTEDLATLIESVTGASVTRLSDGTGLLLSEEVVSSLELDVF